jgi:hypothetical protein
MIAVIFFGIVDFLIALIKAFPKNLWCFWNVRDVGDEHLSIFQTLNTIVTSGTRIKKCLLSGRSVQTMI